MTADLIPAMRETPRLLSKARNRRANVKTAVVHLLHVEPHDSESDQTARAALCGATAAHGWVLDPTWPTTPCTGCLHAAGPDLTEDPEP